MFVVTSWEGRNTHSLEISQPKPNPPRGLKEEEVVTLLDPCQTSSSIQSRSDSQTFRLLFHFLFQSRRISHNAVRFAGIFSTVSSRPNSEGRSQAVSSSQPDIIPIFTKFPKFCSPCWVRPLVAPCQIGGDQAPTVNSSQPTAQTSNTPP